MKKNYSSASSTFGARSRLTVPEVPGAGVAVVVADVVWLVAVESASPLTDFLDFFFLVWDID